MQDVIQGKQDKVCSNFSSGSLPILWTLSFGQSMGQPCFNAMMAVSASPWFGSSQSGLISHVSSHWLTGWPTTNQWLDSFSSTGSFHMIGFQFARGCHCLSSNLCLFVCGHLSDSAACWLHVLLQFQASLLPKTSLLNSAAQRSLGRPTLFSCLVYILLSFRLCVCHCNQSLPWTLCLPQPTPWNEFLRLVYISSRF